MMKNKKFLPLFILMAIISMPIILIFTLNYSFHIIDYSNPSTEQFKSMKNFIKLIFENITIRKMKWEIYQSLFLSFIPPIIFILALIPKRVGTELGKAKFATRQDIEKVSFKPLKFINFYKEKGFKNKIIFLIKAIFIPFETTNVMLGVNFKNGFLLGDFVEGISNKRTPCYQNQPLSVLIVAPPGAGKSAAVAIPNLLRLPTSCIVTDIKGELCDLTAGYRQNVLKNDIYIFNPFGTPYRDKNDGKVKLLKDSNIKFNPLAKKCVEDLDYPQKKQLVEQIANTIFVDDGDAGGAHWIASAKNLFIFFALYDICCKGYSTFFDIARGTNRTYKDINEKSPFFTQIVQMGEGKDADGKMIEAPMKDDKGGYIYKLDSPFEKLFYQQCAMQKFANIDLEENWDTSLKEEELKEIAIEKNTELLDITLQDLATKLGSTPEEEFGSVKTTFNRFMSVFTHKDVAETTSDMSFEYNDLRTRNITLYIKIAQTDIDTLAPLIRILLESIAKNLMTIESKAPNERTYMVLDEFVRFGKMPFLLEMPALCRSYNVVPLYITQSYAQIKKVYGEDDLNIQKGTTAFQILFKMTIADDAEQVSKEVGKFTTEDRSYSTSQGQMIFGGTSSYKKEGRELLTAQDILNIPNDQVIVLVSGEKAKPIVLKAHYYFKDKEDLEKLKIKYNPNWEKEKNLEQPKIIDNIDTSTSTETIIEQPKPKENNTTQETTQNTTQETTQETQKDENIEELQKLEIEQNQKIEEMKEINYPIDEELQARINKSSIARDAEILRQEKINKLQKEIEELDKQIIEKNGQNKETLEIMNKIMDEIKDKKLTGNELAKEISVKAILEFAPEILYFKKMKDNEIKNYKLIIETIQEAITDGSIKLQKIEIDKLEELYKHIREIEKYNYEKAKREKIIKIHNQNLSKNIDALPISSNIVKIKTNKGENNEINES